MAVPGPYAGGSTLCLVARASAFSVGVVYGSLKLKYLTVITNSFLTPSSVCRCSSCCSHEFGERRNLFDSCKTLASMLDCGAGFLRFLV
ncbi:unnamed protein product [Linum trigynum]|uniref:Uncharacterized protein n=1 Tax=Linum trigynum TaxID=586398 RepID=A0AAV2EDN0_9ROSI